MTMSYQVILEIRYNQVLQFSDKTFIGNLISYLGTLGYQVNFFNDNIDAVNSNTKHHINMGANRCGIDFSTKELDFTNFKVIIENLTGISNLLKFNFLNRIGLRVTTLNSYTTISDATKKITNVLNIKNDKLNSIKSSCEVCSLSFAIKKLGHNIKLSILPNQVNISVNGFDQEINTLNLDIDVSEENINGNSNLLEKKYRVFLDEIKEYNKDLNEIF